ncbi:NUDIX domain-containing protein [Saccharothrix sp.]|uniref:NUDIX hydrolase n=1 Tax=Saccharothrix sp. TaxID=1873460 RepID=UPI002810B704|nr:NUDIX domain-containing protein [Saccharothrix sp.]
MNEGWQIPTIAVAVDLVVLTVRSEALQVLLVERGIEPYRGRLALPGGFLSSEQEDIDTAAARELTEETGLDAARLHLEQLGAYGVPDRDPRRRVLTVAYLAIVPDLPEPAAGGDARSAQWTPVAKLGRRRLAFDHSRILADGVERARRRLEYTTLATAFCPTHFTVADLRRVYEIVWGETLDPRNFHRKVRGVADFLVPTGEHTTKHGGRPAALFRRGSAEVLHPAILRGGGN